MACSNNCDVKGRLGVCSHFILNVYALTYTHGQDTQFVHKCRLSLGHYHYQMDELLRVEKEGVAKEEVAVLCAGWWVGKESKEEEKVAVLCAGWCREGHVSRSQFPCF